MKTIKEEIASNLLFYRKRVNLTQKDLAEHLGIKHNSVSAWENGINSIDVEVLFKICEILNISVNDMYGAYSRVTGLTFTPMETDFICKLRKLDERGEKAVCDTLEREYEHVKTASPPKEQANDVAYISPVAARSGEQFNIKATKAKIQASIANLNPSDEQEADEFAKMAREQFLLEKKQEQKAYSAKELDAG